MRRKSSPGRGREQGPVFVRESEQHGLSWGRNNHYNPPTPPTQHTHTMPANVASKWPRVYFVAGGEEKHPLITTLHGGGVLLKMVCGGWLQHLCLLCNGGGVKTTTW